MRYRKPEELKETDVEWIGEIPQSWDFERLKSTVKFCQNGIWGDSPEGDQSDIPCIRVADFDRFLLEIPNQDFTIRSVPKDKRQGKVLKKGDLILEKSGGGDKQPVGAVMLYDLDIDAVCSNFTARMPVKKNYDSSFLRYVHYHLYHGRVNTRSIKQTTGIQNLDSSQYLNEKVGLPPLPEQRSIAAFLDRKTEAINELIQKKEQLIKRLKEKRQALITRAVTKGLNSNVPMKDSGIEWLGEIPEDWEILKVKQVLKFRDNERIPVNSSDRGKMTEKKYPYYGASGIIDYVEDYLFDEKLLLVAEDGANLYSRSSPLAFSAEGKYWVNNHAHILEPRYGPLEFWEYYLQIVVYDPWITGAAQPKLTKDNLGSIPVPYPSKSERENIVKFLSDEDKKINQNVELINTQIEKLKEYRQSLISAAVTGKIDVRSEDEVESKELMA